MFLFDRPAALLGGAPIHCESARASRPGETGPPVGKLPDAATRFPWAADANRGRNIARSWKRRPGSGAPERLSPGLRRGSPAKRT